MRVSRRLAFPPNFPHGATNGGRSPSAVDTHGHNPTHRKEGAAEAQDQVGRGLQRRAPVQTGSGAVVAHLLWGQAVGSSNLPSPTSPPPGATTVPRSAGVAQR